MHPPIHCVNREKVRLMIHTHTAFVFFIDKFSNFLKKNKKTESNFIRNNLSAILLDINVLNFNKIDIMQNRKKYGLKQIYLRRFLSSIVIFKGDLRTILVYSLQLTVNIKCEKSTYLLFYFILIYRISNGNTCYIFSAHEKHFLFFF